MDQQTQTEVVKYLGTIRSKAKKLYAQRYYLHLLYNREIGPDRGTLSAMAAQAVRNNLHSITRIK